MAKLLMVLTAAEVHASIPYSMVCMGRYGSAWNTMHRKRRWKMEFTEAEREAATRLFSQSHNWLLSNGGLLHERERGADRTTRSVDDGAGSEW